MVFPQTWEYPVLLTVTLDSGALIAPNTMALSNYKEVMSTGSYTGLPASGVMIERSFSV